jgi:hypothetical protein
MTTSLEFGYSVSVREHVVVNMIAESAVSRPDGIRGQAIFSEDRRYRYTLTRLWGHDGELTFILLNPSTASAHDDDPTIRRCMAFALREGYSGIVVANLFAFRSTDPKLLRTAADPVGPGNRSVLQGLCSGGRPVVAAWGANAAHSLLRPQADWAHWMLAGAKHPLCFGWTKEHQPKHPLYLPLSEPLVDYLDVIP